MKLLFDENLSPKLPNRLSDLFPGSLHVRDVGMKATIDCGNSRSKYRAKLQETVVFPI